MRTAYNNFVGKPERKRSFGKTRRRWEGNIRIDLRGTEWEDVEWSQVDPDREQQQAVVKAVMNLLVL
jgi:hypothetical protein